MDINVPFTPSLDIAEIVGQHPSPPHPLGVSLSAEDKYTDNGVPHRELVSDPENLDNLVKAMVQWIVTHHVSPAARQRDQVRREALERQGFKDKDPTKRLPSNKSTQKGNWAEILLAEYVTASGNTKLPVYRLRRNPNIDQSMKGDDVLAFDLDSNPVRVLVGEAKFRQGSTTVVVTELVEALEKSYAGSVPASLQFVADELFDTGQEDLGAKVANCNALFAQDKLRLDYLGLLVSDKKAHAHVKSTAKSNVKSLAVMSLVLPDPQAVVSDCFDGAKEVI